MTVTPEILRANKEIRDMLWRFDFVVVDNKEHGPVWFDTTPLEPFAQRHVLLATSEGQAGIMAASLQDCLELVIAHPYWQDVLRFGKGDLSEMRQVLATGSRNSRRKRSTTIQKSRSSGHCCARSSGSPSRAIP